VITVAALLLGTANAARQYFYCAGMDRSMVESCCAHHAIDPLETADDVELQAAPCCEIRHFRTPGPAVETSSPTAPPAPLVALLPALTPPTWSLPSRAPLFRLPPTRAGPKPRAEARAQLQVYLC
jgi:hypothetical protein